MADPGAELYESLSLLGFARLVRTASAGDKGDRPGQSGVDVVPRYPSTRPKPLGDRQPPSIRWMAATLTMRA